MIEKLTIVCIFCATVRMVSVLCIILLNVWVWNREKYNNIIHKLHWKGDHPVSTYLRIGANNILVECVCVFQVFVSAINQKMNRHGFKANEAWIWRYDWTDLLYPVLSARQVVLIIGDQDLRCVPWTFDGNNFCHFVD